jgi:hypothetical protein
MRRALLISVIAVLLSACSNGGSSSSITGPSLATVTENFTGTVDVGGLDFHPFTVTAAGRQTDVIMTAAGPPATIFMGLGVGSLSGDVCSLISNAVVVVQAGTAAQLSGTTSAGSYCVAVFDVGNQSAPVDYAVTVTHY